MILWFIFGVVALLAAAGALRLWSSASRAIALEQPEASEANAEALQAPRSTIIEHEPVATVDGALVPRSATPTHRRWVLALSVLAPAVALGAYVHHRRFVGYHAHKGTIAMPSFGEWLHAETRGATSLGWWYLAGLVERAPEAPTPGRLVVCVHGYTQNATNFVGLRRVLHASGRPTRALSLGHRLAPMSWYAFRLERYLREMHREHPDGFDLIAHSMGGVVLRMVLASNDELRAPLKTVITLGSPHHGTAAARGIPLLPEIRALKRRSALLKGLPHLTDLLPHARIIAVAGDADTVVYPLETALVPGAESIVLEGIGHAGLLTEPRAWGAVRSALGH